MVSPVSTIPAHIASAIDAAGTRNGVDFTYLVQTAIRESSLNPNARAATSSATGLFQFIESTWLEVLKTEGPALGYGHYANQIAMQNGRYSVPDPHARAAILDLRTDPQIASDLAAAFTRRNGEFLVQRFGRMPSAGELYIAHFMGPSGAERFFNAGLTQPDAAAAPMFPEAARANPSIFYVGGRARSVREVYEVLVARHTGPVQGSAPFAAQQLAGGQVPGAQALPSRFEREAPLPPGVSFTALFSTQLDGVGGASPLAYTGRGTLLDIFAEESSAQSDNQPSGGLFFAGLYGQ